MTSQGDKRLRSALLPPVSKCHALESESKFTKIEFHKKSIKTDAAEMIIVARCNAGFDFCAEMENRFVVV